MKNTFRKIIATMLAVMMLISCMSVFAEASEIINGNTWYGDQVSVDITEGTDGYNYMALFRKPIHGYEFAGHFIGAGEGAQTFVVIDTVAHNGTTWTPSGIYELGESNYDVMYCCDVEIMIKDGTYYKRVNLEDSEYYSEKEADMIRAIVSNAYPYVSLAEMKATLKNAGFAYADELTRSEIISAVQAAIWASANGMTAEDFRYVKTYRVTDNFGWGQPVHDISDEAGYGVTGNRKFETYEEVGVRHDALVDYLLALEPVKAPDNQIVITDIEIVDSVPALEGDGTVTTTLKVALNNSGSSEKDSIKLDVYVDGVLAKTEDVVLGTTDYEFTVDARVGQVIKAVVSGTQDLPRGVYFYAPKPADVDGDGVATSREVSQNLVGVAAGMTEVYADAEVTVPNETEITVNKTWNDEDNRDGKRPESVTVRLLADGTEVASKALSAENNWEWTFDNIPLVNENGTVINYTVTEDKVEGYEAVIEKFSVTNVHQPEITFVEVKKTWDDGDNRDAIRPENVTVRLHANGVEIASQILNEGNDWTAKFEDLYKYENGEEIVYTVTEDAVENYNPTINRTETGFEIENYYKPMTTFVNVSKVWNDGDNRDGKRPESVTIALLADGEPTEHTLVLNAENDFTGTFVDLPVNRAGKKIEYTVAEIGAAPYVSTVEGDSEAGFKVTNTYVPETVEVSGTKTWVDDDNRDGIRPESITISLLANGEVVDTKVVTEKDGWAWTFENLYKYENGEEIVYTITEDAVEGYETVVDGYNVTNTHEVEEEIIPPAEDEEEKEIDDPEIPLVPADKKPEEKPEVKPEAKPEVEETVEIEDEEVPLAPEFTAPQTGDTSSLFTWLAVAVVTGTLFIIVSTKMRRAANER